MNEAPQIPARFPVSPHDSRPYTPAAQPTLDVLSIGVGESRAAGFPISSRLLAIADRLSARHNFFWSAHVPLRCLRVMKAARAAMSRFPEPRSRRIGTSLMRQFESDHAYHQRMLDVLDYATCPGPCAICDAQAALRVDEWAYQHQRDAQIAEAS